MICALCLVPVVQKREKKNVSSICLSLDEQNYLIFVLVEGSRYPMVLSKMARLENKILKYISFRIVYLEEQNETT